MSRRRAMGRIAAGTAIAWGAPVILSSTQAAAAASCIPAVLDWDLLTTGSTFTSSTVDGVTVSVSTSFSGGTSALGTNRTIIGSPQGGIAQKALRFEQTPVNGGGQLITISFSQPVYSVSFLITDIDNVTGSWSDRIVLVTTGLTGTVPAGSNVVGAGTAGDPYRNSNANLNIANTSGAGNLQVTHAGPISSFQFTFGCGASSGGSNQLINLTDIAFCR